MKKKQLKTQITLIIIGFLLIIITYFIYPYSKEVRIDKKQDSQLDLKQSDNLDSSFEHVEYEGFYNLNEPFIVKSEKALILNEQPDIVYMTNMHVILHLDNGTVLNIVSNKGTFNKVTYDCFFVDKVKATDGETEILAKNLDLLATKNSIEIYNNVVVNYSTGAFEADKVKYDFETKSLKASMYDDRAIKMKIFK